MCRFHFVLKPEYVTMPGECLRLFLLSYFSTKGGRETLRLCLSGKGVIETILPAISLLVKTSIPLDQENVKNSSNHS